MVTDYTLTKLENAVDRAKTNQILVDKADVQALLNEIRTRRVRSRIAAPVKRVG